VSNLREGDELLIDSGGEATAAPAAVARASETGGRRREHQLKNQKPALIYNTS
jgi:hypothetical protein